MLVWYGQMSNWIILANYIQHKSLKPRPSDGFFSLLNSTSNHASNSQALSGSAVAWAATSFSPLFFRLKIHKNSAWNKKEQLGWLVWCFSCSWFDLFDVFLAVGLIVWCFSCSWFDLFDVFLAVGLIVWCFSCSWVDFLILVKLSRCFDPIVVLFCWDFCCKIGTWEKLRSAKNVNF